MGNSAAIDVRVPKLMDHFSVSIRNTLHFVEKYKRLIGFWV